MYESSKRDYDFCGFNNARMRYCMVHVQCGVYVQLDKS